VNGAFDPRELTINRFDAWYGEPEMQQKTVFVNAGNDLANGVKVYGWAATSCAMPSRPATSARRRMRATSSRSTRTASCR
jgi:hypothetical protein